MSGIKPVYLDNRLLLWQQLQMQASVTCPRKTLNALMEVMLSVRRKFRILHKNVTMRIALNLESELSS